MGNQCIGSYGFDWKDLEQPIRQGWVKLVSAKWLVQLADAGGTLKRRQDLPPEAFIGLTALKRMRPFVVQGLGIAPIPCLRVIVLSYPWLQPGHPDPHGESLRAIAKVLRACLEYSIGEKETDFGVLIDFTALPQVPRDTEEDKVNFKRGLQALNYFYSHPKVIVLKVTKFPEGYPDRARYDLPEGANIVPYSDRGWCFTEESMSGLVKSDFCCLDLGLMRDSHEANPDIHDLGLSTGMNHRMPPLIPDVFARRLDEKTFTNKNGDFEKVNNLYASAFNHEIPRASELHYKKLKWGDTEMELLAPVLEKACSLRLLDLSGNSIGDAGMQHLATALKCHASLHDLNVAENKIGAVGAGHLAEAMQGHRSVRRIQMARNSIGDVGAERMAEAIRGSDVFQTLYAYQNSIGDAGAGHLAQSLRDNKTLKNLILNGNAITDVGAQCFAQALSSSALLWLDLNENSLTDAAGSHFGEALGSNPALRNLFLDYNQLTDVGVGYLADGLRRNRKLRVLFVVRQHPDLRREVGTELLHRSKSRALKINPCTWGPMP